MCSIPVIKYSSTDGGHLSGGRTLGSVVTVLAGKRTHTYIAVFLVCNEMPDCHCVRRVHPQQTPELHAHQLTASIHGPLFKRQSCPFCVLEKSALFQLHWSFFF